MRRLRYQVAMSLDGYIAGPNGEYDWIPMDPEIDFQAIVSQFDTLCMGKNTYLPLAARELDPMFKSMKLYVVSQTLDQDAHPDVAILSRGWEDELQSLKSLDGKDIWLFGGGQLFRSCLEAGLVDTIEIALLPVLLGEGIPMLPAPGQMKSLQLTRHQIYPNSGITVLEYNVL